MKNKYLLGILAISFLCTSCNNLLEPQYATSNDVLSWVYAAAEEEYMSTMLHSDDPFEQRMIEGMQELMQSIGYECKVPEEDRIAKTSMMEWILNSDVQGDTYTGYFITYQVELKEEIVYALIDLVEFDNTGKYEIKLVGVERTISDINDYFE